MSNQEITSGGRPTLSKDDPLNLQLELAYLAEAVEQFELSGNVLTDDELETKHRQLDQLQASLDHLHWLASHCNIKLQVNNYELEQVTLEPGSLIDVDIDGPASTRSYPR